ncbi:putative nitroreductase [Exophiala oligosperma]
MHAHVLWTALEQDGLGASLQHYNPLIDQGICKTWGISPEWELKAQLVFGKPTGQPDEKTFQPLEDRLKIFRGK